MHQTKQCSKCRRELPYSAFYVHPKTLSGRQSQCKDCVRGYEVEPPDLSDVTSGLSWYESVSITTWLKHFAKEAVCELCGKQDSLIDVSAFEGSTLLELEQEARKYDIVCTACTSKPNYRELLSIRRRFHRYQKSTIDLTLDSVRGLVLQSEDQRDLHERKVRRKAALDANSISTKPLF